MKTTAWGLLAALAIIAHSIPGLPPWMKTFTEILGGLCVGGLGWHAKDCPPNCPGTDEYGKPKVPVLHPLVQRVLALLLLGALVLTIALSCIGCAWAKSTVTRTRLENGLPVTDKATVVGFALLDSNQALQRATAHATSNTNGTWSPSAAMSGLTQSASSTGLTVIVNAILPAAVAAATK